MATAARPNEKSGKILLKHTLKIAIDTEQIRNYVLYSFREESMFRAVMEEAAALTSIALFLGMIAIWAQVISAM